MSGVGSLQDEETTWQRQEGVDWLLLRTKEPKWVEVVMGCSHCSDRPPDGSVPL